MEITAVTDKGRFVRIVPTNGSLLESISSLVRHVEAAGLAVDEVKSNTESCLSCSAEHPLYFTNICGKIEHYDVCNVTHAAVTPYILDQHDAFGSALCLYSMHCSLRISKSLTSTLFRGGCSSASIAEVIEHAILPETIRSCSVHMIVCSARLGRPVLMQDDLLVTQMQSVNDWQCQHILNDGEMQKYHSLKLHGFTEEWLCRVGLSGDACPQSCLLNICRTGTVNMFVSISPGVKFHTRVEMQYCTMLESILDVLRAFT